MKDSPTTDSTGFFLMYDDQPSWPMRGLIIGLAIEVGAVLLVCAIGWLLSCALLLL